MNQAPIEHPQLRQAWACYQQADREKVRALCGNMIASSADVVPSAWLLLSMCELDDGNLLAATAALDEIDDVLALRVPVAILRGQCALADERYNEARTAFRVALDYQPDSSDAWFGAARAALGLGQHQEAKDALRQAIAIQPANANAQFLFGVMALEANESAEAISAFVATAKLLPEAPEVSNNLGLAYQLAGDTKRAAAAFRRAVELAADFAQAWFNLAGVEATMGNLPEAERCHAKALTLDPDLSVHGKPWSDIAA
jgi:tetratricopeptide (TPR) repeat protein